MDAAKTKDGITTTIISNNNSSSASNGAYVRQMLNGANEKKSEGSGSAKQSRMVAIGQVTKGANFIDHIFGCNVGQHPTSNIVSVSLWPCQHLPVMYVNSTSSTWLAMMVMMIIMMVICPSRRKR